MLGLNSTRVAAAGAATRADTRPAAGTVQAQNYARQATVGHSTASVPASAPYYPSRSTYSPAQQPSVVYRPTYGAPAVTSAHTTHHVHHHTPSYVAQNTSPVADAINLAAYAYMLGSTLNQAAQDRREANRVAREERAELTRPSDPAYGTLRYLANTPDANLHKTQLNTVLYCYRNRHGTDTLRTGAFSFPADADDFYDQLRACRTEQESRDYILFIKNNLQDMVEASSFTPEQKRSFKDALNTHDKKNDWYAFANTVGWIIGAVTIGISFSVALQGALLGAALTGLIGLATSTVPSTLVGWLVPSQRYFPTDRGAICQPMAFLNWVDSLSANAASVDPDALDMAVNNRHTPMPVG